MKKVLCFVLATCLLVGFAPAFSAFADEADNVWTFGQGERIEEQGENGWYLLFSEVSGIGDGVFPVDGIRQNVILNEMSHWYLWWGVAPIWMPYTLEEPSWWTQFADEGRMQPHYSLSAIVGWSAPFSGDFYVNAMVSGGLHYNFQPEYDDYADGVFASIRLNNALLFGENFADIVDMDNPVAWGDVVTMEEGDFLYFITDPNENFGHDIAFWNITITVANGYETPVTLPAELPEETEIIAEEITVEAPVVGNYYAEWTFGQGIRAQRQGENNWFFMFSEASNQGNAFPVNTIRQNVLLNEMSHWYLWWGVAPMWMPYTLNEASWWTQFDDEGRMQPHYGLSAVMGWRAPFTGIFDLTVFASAGLHYNYDPEWEDPVDGVFLSIYHNAMQLYGANFTDVVDTDNLAMLIIGSVEMTAGDFLYFIVDPNEYYDHDMAMMSVSIRALSRPIDALTPRVVDGRQYLPIRALAAAHGLEHYISWADGHVNLNAPGLNLRFRPTDVGGFNERGTVYVPLAFALEHFG